MSGGVRNLRAMFENKDESSTSPPDRGRSPVGSVGGGSNGTSPRPLSKVRTSFVAVERNGQLGNQWGLRKESNADPSLATRRGSFSIDEETDPKAMSEKKQSISSEISARNHSTSVVETIPEFAIESPPVIAEAKPNIINGNTGREMTVSKGSTNTTVKLEENIKNIAIQERVVASETKSGPNVSGGLASNNATGIRESAKGNNSGEVKTLSPTKTTKKPNTAGRSPKPTPLTTTPSPNATKAPSKSIKSSVAPKTPTTPAKTPTTPGKSSNQMSSKPTASSSTIQTRPGEKHITKPTSSSISTAKPGTRPSTSSTVASTSDKKTAHTFSSTGFHKPRPKSPTKPAKLPASMTAPTASSLSKVSATSIAPNSRQSLAPPTKTVYRSSSNTNLGQKQDLRRRPSSINNDRPALGRPSISSLQRQPSRQSLSRQTAPADESFLARMMRPTTSSASKTTEKVTTPPKPKMATRPTTRDGPTHHHQSQETLRGSPSSKKVLSAPKGKNEGFKTISSIDGNGPATSAGDVGPSQPPIPGNENTKPSAGLKDEDHIGSAMTETVVGDVLEKEPQIVFGQPSTELEISTGSSAKVPPLTESTDLKPEMIALPFDSESAVEEPTVRNETFVNGEVSVKKEDAPKVATLPELETSTVNSTAPVQIEGLEAAENIPELASRKLTAKESGVSQDEEVD